MGLARIVWSVALVGVLLLGLTVVIACNNDDDESTTDEWTMPIGYEWYEDSALGYKIARSSDWIVTEGDVMADQGQLAYMIFQEAEDAAAHVSVMVSTGTTIADGIKSVGEEISINGQKAYQSINEIEMFGYTVIQRVVALAAHDRSYIVTCLAPSDVYETYQDVFNNAVSSFTVE